MVDMLVAGAGPIGLATAVNGVLKGLDVAVVEPRGGNIDKACGEGLMPDALERLAALGVDPPGRAFRGIRYVAGADVAEARFSGGPGRGVRRTVLHAALMERAQALGVRFVPGKVDGIVQGEGWIEAAGIRARYLVGADGLHSQVRSTLGLASRARGGHRFGVRQHFAIRPWTDMVEVHWLREVEVYVTPVGDSLVGVAVLGRAPLRLDEALQRLPELRERLQGASTASAPRGAGPLRQRVKARHAGRALLVGDAAGYVDALTGEGLRIGFAEAEAAVRAIVAGNLDEYEAEWRRITRSYRYLTNTLLLTTSQRELRGLVVPTARALPWAFRRIVDSLAY